MIFPRIAAFGVLAAALLPAQTPLGSLKRVPVPEPPGLDNYVRDKNALVALGKVFFWDMQAGSDGVTACATCHFHAGADHRMKNTLSDLTAGFPLNADLANIAFPFRLLNDPSNRNSGAIRDSSMRVGSAGLARRIFDGIVPGQAAELGHDELDKPEFLRDGLQVRRVTARNSPSVFNTAYYVQQFWDGRAVRNFNGFTVTGLASEAPGVLVSNEGTLRRENVRLDLASLASQAVGPALDHLEMSYEGRTWPLLGRKLFSLRPLGQQRVSDTDSVLGGMANPEGPGLREEFTYRKLVEDAFWPKYWESAELAEGDFSQSEQNFSFFWGLALQAYQATLNSDDSRFDRFMEGDRTALTAEEQSGLQFFQGPGNCNECHSGPEFSAAAFNVNRTTRGNHAFDRTGVRPVSEDIGQGNGVFKSIGLRNVEFTGPYFHNGGQATLEQVVDFYRRAGDFTPVANDLRPFQISATQRAALVAFLKSLSDDRVRYERAPFDHPELCVPVGHLENEAGRLVPQDGFPSSSMEDWRLVPAVGAAGNTKPLRTFEEALQGVTDRAHSLQETCRVQ